MAQQKWEYYWKMFQENEFNQISDTFFNVFLMNSDEIGINRNNEISFTLLDEF